jgi:hypothetical protein
MAAGYVKLVIGCPTAARDPPLRPDLLLPARTGAIEKAACGTSIAGEASSTKDSAIRLRQGRRHRRSLRGYRPPFSLDPLMGSPLPP